jgi:hypothetical protein
VIPYDKIRATSSINNKEEAYSIRFDSVGYYDGYEIEITRTSDGKLLYSDVILFSQDYDDKRIQSINQAKTCEILLELRMLANKCYSIFPIRNLDNIPDTDKGCNLCALECLYKKSWCIRLRGVIEGLAKDDLWTEEICNFMLECPKKK